jgi:Ca2+:H+ antiporter
MTNIDSIKRAARKEAWYGDSYNPFRKNMVRSHTSPLHQGDLEAQVSQPSRAGVEENNPLSAIATDPIPQSPVFGSIDNSARPASKENEYQMTSATTSGQGKQREGDSEETAVEKESTRVPSEETKARRRFLSRFKKGRSESHDSYNEKPKKRAWYKGKILKHKPFTVRNQLGATIFNSWINILLLCAPIGIALNYAGVDKKAVFVVNFVAIIPLAGMLSFATEEIALHVGESLGGLLNASFG